VSIIRNRAIPTTPQAKRWRHKEVRDGWRSALFRCGARAIRVGIVLRDYMNCGPGGYAWLRRKKLGALSRVSRPEHVSHALAELEKAELITRYIYGPELAQVFPVRLNREAYQTVYVLHRPEDAFDIRDWHEKRGIPRRSVSSPRKAKRRVAKTFEVIDLVKREAVHQ